MGLSTNPVVAPGPILNRAALDHSWPVPKKTEAPRPLRPAQSQSRRPGRESEMTPRPRSERAQIAPTFAFFAPVRSSYLTGQVLHPNGGEIING
jgi:NAD(P)-dependent dehydrogenase (short-subunit alcohol dehydrogenase family)